MSGQPRWRHASLWGFLAGGSLFVIGAPLPQSVLVAIAIVAAGPVLEAAGIELRERPGVPRYPRREGSRTELAQLIRQPRRRSRGPNEDAVRRLRSIARRRLADLGVEVDDATQVPRARELLGSSTYDALLAGPASTPMSDRQFTRCIDAVESLARHRREGVTGPTTDARGAS